VSNDLDAVGTMYDCHKLMVELVMNCEVILGMLDDPTCSWVRQYYTLSHAERDVFWASLSAKDHSQGLLCHLVLMSFEYISPSIMKVIYKCFCGLSKEEQSSILSLTYLAKCWQDNREFLQRDNFVCYSPSYALEESHWAQSPHNSVYVSSWKVQLGVKFLCARCSELSGMGYSRLKHSTNFPFTLDEVNLDDVIEMEFLET
jgi:hypothetical protein